MATNAEREQVRLGRYMSQVQRIRGKLWTDHGSERQARHRAEWPELWEAIDALVELVDEDRPPYGVNHRGLFQRDG